VAEYRDLMAQDEQLDILGQRCTAEEHQPAEEPIEDQVEEAERHSHDHAWSLSNADHRRSQLWPTSGTPRGAPAEAMLEATAALARGGVLVDIGGMMERPGLDLFSMMCAQRSVIGSLWFSTAEAQSMADMAGSGALSVLEHHLFPLAEVNEAFDSIPEGHGGLHELPLPALIRRCKT
jgi:D-arabinose 1-dehydrogenase-like Zn-dependent alcohol dehydrogenase